VLDKQHIFVKSTKYNGMDTIKLAAENILSWLYRNWSLSKYYGFPEKIVKMAEHFSLKKKRYDFSPLYTLIILLAAGSDQSQSIST
jgi:hypothetical protein